MCRFFIYFNNNLKKKNNLWNELFLKPCGFFKQSYLPKYTPKLEDNHRNFNIHGDGFGFWGKHNYDEFYYKLEKPIWQDMNLEHLLKNKEFLILFAHIRAIHPFSNSSISYNNCHPFQFGDFVFMHNGFLDLGGLKKINLIKKIDENLIEFIKGTTDTELLFFWFITFYNDWIEKNGYYYELGFIFKEWFVLVFSFCEEFGIDSASFNFGLYNKKNEELLVSRVIYSINIFKNHPPSLYLKLNKDELYLFSEPTCYKEKIFKINFDNFIFDKQGKKYEINKNSILNKTFIFPKNMILYKKRNVDKLHFYEI